MIDFTEIVRDCNTFGLDFEYHIMHKSEARLIFRKSGASSNDRRQRVMERVVLLDRQDNIQYCSDFYTTLHYELIHFKDLLEADEKENEEYSIVDYLNERSASAVPNVSTEKMGCNEGSD